eukprot:228120_1
MTLVNEHRVVKSQDAKWSIAWLTPPIKAGRHHGKYQIENNAGSSTCCIGIFKAEYALQKVNTHLACGKNMGYAFFWKYCAIMDHSSGLCSKDYGTSCKAGDTIDMYCDLDQMTMNFSVNGIDYGVAYDNMAKCEYRAAVDLYHN